MILAMTHDQHSIAALHLFTSLDAFLRVGDEPTFGQFTEEMAIINAAFYVKPMRDDQKLRIALRTILKVVEGIQERYEMGEPGYLQPSQYDRTRIFSCMDVIDRSLKRIPYHVYQGCRLHISAIINNALDGVSAQ